jgi:hypothetical protein
MSTASRYDRCVFINCPFDKRFERIFHALVFTVYDCGFIPRSALEAENNPQRFSRIIEIIRESKLSVHDLSRAGVDRVSRLARFNMPLELGLFIGAMEFGKGEQKQKTFVMFDRDRYRYQKFISDLNGYDPKPHGNKAESAVKNLRNWLSNVSAAKGMIPGGAAIWNRYKRFRKDLPKLAGGLHQDHRGLTYKDYCSLVEAWLQVFSKDGNNVA